VGTHVYAFYLANGHWPEPFCLHKCDNPPCCNPSHLFEGDAAENAEDRNLKGRQPSGPEHSQKVKDGWNTRRKNIATRSNV
jgi:hypothetical protein